MLSALSLWPALCCSTKYQNFVPGESYRALVSFRGNPCTTLVGHSTSVTPKCNRSPSSLFLFHFPLSFAERICLLTLALVRRSLFVSFLALLKQNTFLAKSKDLYLRKCSYNLFIKPTQSIKIWLTFPWNDHANLVCI